MKLLMLQAPKRKPRTKAKASKDSGRKKSTKDKKKKKTDSKKKKPSSKKGGRKRADPNDLGSLASMMQDPVHQ